MLDSTASTPALPGRSAASYKRERALNILWEFSLVIIGAALGALHALAVTEADPQSWHGVAQISTEIIIFGVLGFLVREMTFLRNKIDDIEVDGKTDRERIINTEIATHNELSRLSKHAERSIDIRYGIYDTIASAFSHENDMVRRCLLTSIRETLQPLRINRDYLSAQDDRLSRNLYENFWDELLEEQIRLGKGNPLKVYVVHSSSIKVFEDRDQQTDVLIRQGQFKHKGGEIRRILIRDPKLDSKEPYEQVIAAMDGAGILVKLLEVSKSEPKFKEDFLLVEVGDQPYVLQWQWSDSEEKFGQVSGTQIHTRERCNSFYGRWRTILDELRTRKPQEDLTGWHV